MKTDITLPTDDGDARAFVFTPDTGSGPWPGRGWKCSGRLGRC